MLPYKPEELSKKYPAPMSKLNPFLLKVEQDFDSGKAESFMPHDILGSSGCYLMEMMGYEIHQYLIRNKDGKTARWDADEARITRKEGEINEDDIILWYS